MNTLYYNQTQTVFVVNLQYLIGWKNIKADEIEDTDKNNVIGIYKNKDDAYKTAINFNINSLNDIIIYSGDYIDLNNYKNDLDSINDTYNNLLSFIKTKRLQIKHLEKYAIVNEFNIQ